MIPLKPLSVNKAWRGGRRFRTKDYIQYEKDLLVLLPKKHYAGEVEVHYKFHIKNYGLTDVSNLIKCLEDIIVKAGCIEDDRKVVKISAEKIKSSEHYIEIEIKPYENQTKE